MRLLTKKCTLTKGIYSRTAGSRVKKIGPSKFHFARFTLHVPPNTSVFLPRPLTPLHAPFLARSSPVPRPASPVPRFKQFGRQNGQKRNLPIGPLFGFLFDAAPHLEYFSMLSSSPLKRQLLKWHLTLSNKDQEHLCPANSPIE